MKANRLNIAIWLGFAAILGTLVLQLYLLRQSVLFEEKKFNQKVHVSLLETASKLNELNKSTVQQQSPIEKIKGDYYIVNVNNKFDSSSLAFYLKNEFEKFDLITDYEFAVYDCHNEKMGFGNYYSVKKETLTPVSSAFPVMEKLVYYFVVHFPKKDSYIYNNLKLWIAFAAVMLLALIIYAYTSYNLLQQKKYSALQKDFINNMTHEFKTPISSLLIASRYISGNSQVQHDEKLRKYADVIYQQSEKLNQHVEKVLQLAKTDNNALTLNKTTFDAVPIVNKLVEHTKLKHPEVSFVLNMPGHFMLTADEFHFTNLLHNLTDNSIKYCSQNPVITIILADTKGQKSITVADNGIGIPQKHLQHIQKKFYRVQNDRSNAVSGFGLGLYYVNRICREHKWKMNISSQEQKGTTIDIILNNDK